MYVCMYVPTYLPTYVSMYLPIQQLKDANDIPICSVERVINSATEEKCTHSLISPQNKVI